MASLSKSLPSKRALTEQCHWRRPLRHWRPPHLLCFPLFRPLVDRCWSFVLFCPCHQMHCNECIFKCDRSQPFSPVLSSTSWSLLEFCSFLGMPSNALQWVYSYMIVHSPPHLFSRPLVDRWSFGFNFPCILSYACLKVSLQALFINQLLVFWINVRIK